MIKFNNFNKLDGVKVNEYGKVGRLIRDIYGTVVNVRIDRGYVEDGEFKSCVNVLAESHCVVECSIENQPDYKKDKKAVLGDKWYDILMGSAPTGDDFRMTDVEQICIDMGVIDGEVVTGDEGDDD
jgi:hypothetical protein